MARNSIDYINVSEIRTAISETLQVYQEQIKGNINKVEENLAKKALKKLRVSGNFENHRNSKGYRKGWRAKKLDSNGWVIFNATNPGLTSLLEYGHSLKNGGRTIAFPHIKPVELEVIKEFEAEVKEALRG